MYCSFCRRKREVATSTVDKGVNERIRLTQIYDKRKEELEKHHLEVRQHVEEERAKVRPSKIIRLLWKNYRKIYRYVIAALILQSKTAILHEYEEKLKTLHEDFKSIPENDENTKKEAA